MSVDNTVFDFSITGKNPHRSEVANYTRLELRLAGNIRGVLKMSMLICVIL
jgi:hypothetical protein